MKVERKKVEVSTSSGNIANAVLAAAFRPLTQKQIYQLTEGKKHWSEKKHFGNGYCKNHYYEFCGGKEKRIERFRETGK